MPAAKIPSRPAKLPVLLGLALLGSLCWNLVLQSRLDRALATVSRQELAGLVGGPAASPPSRFAQPDPAAAPTLPPRGHATDSVDAFWDAPEYQAVLAAAARDSLSRRYDALWDRLDLAPELRERTRDLLAERQLRAIDLVRAGQAQGMPDAEIHALLDQADEQIEANLRLVLGAEGHAAFQSHERRLVAQEQLARFTREIGRAAAPLSPAQSDALLRLFTEAESTSAADSASPAINPLHRVLLGVGGAEASASTPVRAGTLNAAGAVLDPAQLEVLAHLGRPSAED